MSTQKSALRKPENQYEDMRRERGWPTPNHMRHAADALDQLVIPRYGDVLRWFADLCDQPPIPPHAFVAEQRSNLCLLFVGGGTTCGQPTDAPIHNPEAAE